MVPDNDLARLLTTHVLRIEQLEDENGELVIKLKSSDIEIAELKIEIKRLADGQVELNIKLSGAINEIGRLGMVIKHRLDSEEKLRRH